MTPSTSCLKEGSRVRLTKLESTLRSTAALPEAYTLDGILLSDLAVGRAIKVWREIRNGIKIPGLFTSSPIKRIEGDKILTNNSIWKIEEKP